MRVLVTGATGVLGRRAVPALVSAGHEVVAVARTEAKATAVRKAGAEPIALDLLDPVAVASAVEGVEAVANLATSIPPTSKAAFRRAWAENDRLRRDASAILVDAAVRHGVPRFVQESITFLYADAGAEWIDEHAPIDAVGVTTTATIAEQNTARVTETGGAGIVLRFAQFVADDSGHLREMWPMLRRGALPLFGDPDGYESYIDVEDAAAAVVAALSAPAGVYNVGDDDPLTRRQHAEVVSEALGRSVRLPPAFIGSVPALKVRARSQRISNRHLRDVTGWAPATASMRDRWPDLLAALGRELS